MNVIKTICKKEWSQFFSSPIAYVTMISFVVLCSWFYFRQLFLINLATYRGFFDFTPWIFLFLVPAMSMRIWSEEKKEETLDFLFTLPIKDSQLILGKFIANALLLLLLLIFTLPLVGVLYYLGDPDTGAIVTGYIGLYFLSLCFLSIGMVISALTKNQIICFIVTLTLCFIFYLLGTPGILFSLPASFSKVLTLIALGSHVDSISRGILDSRNITYFISFIILFLFLNLQIFDQRRVSK